MTEHDDTEGTRKLREQGPQGTVFVAPTDLPDLDQGGDGERITPESPALVGLAPPFSDHWYRLQPERTQVGRKPHNDIVLDEASVSFEHARIVRTAGEWRVVNLLSTNGTFVNGQKVHQSRLEHGDRLAFGNAAFLFATSDSVDPSPRSFHPQAVTRRQKQVAAAVAIAGAIAVGLLFWLL
ncbi:hypothetical protein J2T60_001012 [Natronospira proteinivora]|uniref:FHA domain-containing protein n=1 Tax=Natronospira proteinivora TaxID=1807133 RepID=A0ABT1G7J4_9GAMM|nr:FHA domain-containing protein [Natronospira proteinivora]MCP1727047.1 hypothetical protein [Natronospira proteinivora]